jgi:hypothetical protein
MWLDEADLVWDRQDRNFYTAHEIAQVIPLVNKGGTFERFIYLNRWIKDYWPNRLKLIRKPKKLQSSSLLNFLIYPFELLAFWFQYLYMKKRITREVVTPTRGVFHPRDWGKIVTFHLTRTT